MCKKIIIGSPFDELRALLPVVELAETTSTSRSNRNSMQLNKFSRRNKN